MTIPASASSRFGGLAKCLRLYRATAIILLNLLILAVLFNVALHVMFRFRGPEPGLPSTNLPSFPEESMAKVYPDFSPAERTLMLREIWERPYAYRDYVLFKERPINGKYVKVSEVGFRHVKGQGPWPPAPTNLNVFVFGGSTTFGYGLPDWQTIPSYLQEALSARSKKRVCVYNFGVGWYYSTQERVLFERLLTDGFVPHVAVFIDGFNDSQNDNDVLPFSPRFAELFEEVSRPGMARSVSSLVGKLPTGRAIRGLERRRARAASDDFRPRADLSLQKYLKNKELIGGLCQQFNITPLFVWQPVPGYKYDLQLHLFRLRQDYSRLTYAYEEMAKVPGERLGSNFIWAADLQEHAQECLYVDANHYADKVCKMIANFVAETAGQRKLLDRHGIEQAPF